MGNYSAALLEAILRGESLQTMIDIELVSGTTLRFAPRYMRKRSIGTYAGRVLQMGEMVYPTSDYLGGIAYPRLEAMTVEDADGSLGRELELSHPEGSSVLVRMGAFGVDVADWFTAFGNAQLDDWKLVAPGVWELLTVFNEMPLRSAFPRTPVLRSDFPKCATPDLYTKYVLLIYGIHDSRNAGGSGSVPLLHVDTEQGWFGPILGAVTISEAYTKAAGESTWTHLDGSDFEELHVTINGREYTLLHVFTPPEVGTEARIDAVGYRDGIGGAGDLLTGADALLHLLVNFIFPSEDWKSGAWFLPSTAPVEESFFDEMQVFLEQLGWEEVSRVYGGALTRVKGEEAVREFSQECAAVGGCGTFFTFEGKFAIRPNVFYTETLHHTGLRALRYDRQMVEPPFFELGRDRNNLVDRLNVLSILNTAEQEFQWALEIRALESNRNRAGELQLLWSKARVE